jgi:hypothetical protein
MRIVRLQYTFIFKYVTAGNGFKSTKRMTYQVIRFAKNVVLQ